MEKLRGAGVAETHLMSKEIVSTFANSGLMPLLFSNAASMKWSKLLTNLLSNAASAILDMPPSQVFAHPRLFEMEREQLRETLGVMKAQGIAPVDLPKTPVKLLVFAVQHLPPGLSCWILRRAVGGGTRFKNALFPY